MEGRLSPITMDCQDPIVPLASSRRILVLGSSGSGKTTFSINLSRILNLKTIHLDAHFWKPGWIATPQPQWRAIVASLVETESWIMDGTYESSLDLRIPAADSVIVIESSRWICLWRALKRKATVDDQRRPDAPGGQKLDRAFLRYIWRYPTVTRPLVFDCIRRYGPDKTTIQLEGKTEIQEFLRQIQQAVERGMDNP